MTKYYEKNKELICNLKKSIDVVSYYRSVGHIRSIYAEFYVANKLEKNYKVQIGDIRDVTKSDIYLPEIKKNVEVKAAGYREWGSRKNSNFEWKIGDEQDKKFDFLILIGYEKRKAKIMAAHEAANVFSRYKKKKLIIIIDRNECKDFLHGLKAHDNEFNGICIGMNERSKGENVHGKKSDIERKIIKQPNEFLERWDKIK
jgi:hypothetical protein